MGCMNVFVFRLVKIRLSAFLAYTPYSTEHTTIPNFVFFFVGILLYAIRIHFESVFCFSRSIFLLQQLLCVFNRMEMTATVAAAAATNKYIYFFRLRKLYGVVGLTKKPNKMLVVVCMDHQTNIIMCVAVCLVPPSHFSPSEQ